MSTTTQRAANLVSRANLTAAFIVHFALAAAWWWVSPKGFPPDHSRFWLNTVFPFAIMAIAAYGLLGRWKHNPPRIGLAATMLASCWLGGSIAGRLLFPTSLRVVWMLGLLVAIVGFALAWQQLRASRLSIAKLLAGGIVGLPCGLFAIWAQIAPPATTSPMKVALPEPSSGWQSASPAPTEVETSVRLDPSSATLSWSRREVRFYCYPLLRFDRVSPDRFWSLIAPPHQTSNRRLSHTALDDHGSWYTYGDRSVLQIATESAPDSSQCTAWTELDADTYSHLNSYCILGIKNCKNVTLAFSPCAESRIEVLPADYPTGRPARMAFLSNDSAFSVVEASSGEKGPFRTLAGGRLRRGDPLSIRFFDNKKHIATVTLHDWSAQLSTELSPTAGWGVPQNAIEFRRAGETQDSDIEIFITLAATSVGRGYETVGHRTGVYRNRLSVQLLP